MELELNFDGIALGYAENVRGFGRVTIECETCGEEWFLQFWPSEEMDDRLDCVDESIRDHLAKDAEISAYHAEFAV